jgi:glycosyltransferase involved in cell wall biosynthesis
MHNKKMKVLLYEENDEVYHGNQKYIFLLLDRIKKLEQNDGLACSLQMNLLTRSRSVLYEKTRALAQDAETIAVYSVASGNNVEILHGFPALIRRIQKVFAMVRNLRPDVILCHNERSFLISVPAAIMFRVPIIWHIKIHRKLWYVDLACALLSSGIISISPESTDVKGSLFARIAKDKTGIIPLGIDFQEFKDIPLPEDHGSPLRVLLPGSVSKGKGIDIAINALNLLCSRGIPVVLHIAGGTKARDTLFAEQMKASGAYLEKAGALSWLGWRDDMPDLYAWADIVMLPSRNEALPRSLVEAQAASRPVIGSQVGSIPLVIADGVNGLLVPPEDPEALALALERMAADFSLRRQMGLMGKEHALEMFDFERHFQRLFDFLEQVSCSKK